MAKRTSKTTQQPATTAPAVPTLGAALGAAVAPAVAPAGLDINAIVAAAVAQALAAHAAPAVQAPVGGSGIRAADRANTPTPNLATAPAAAPVPKTRRAAFEQYVNAEQARLLDDSFAVACEAKAHGKALAEQDDARKTSLAARMRELVGKVWPAPVDFATYDGVRKATYAYDVAGNLLPAATQGETHKVNDGATYWGKAFAAAYKGAHGAVPTKGTGSGRGTKGMSAKKAARGFGSKCADVLEYMATLKKHDINAAVLKRVDAAVAELIAATEAMTKAVNE